MTSDHQLTLSFGTPEEVYVAPEDEPIYGPPTAEQAGWYSFKGLGGRAFRQPRLVDQGIEVDEFCYVRMDERVVLRQSMHAFDFSAKPVQFSEHGVWGRSWRIPATLRNLETFCLLPFLSDDQRIAGLDLYRRWTTIIPSACILAIALRGGATRRRTEFPHRVPVVRSTTEQVTVRDLTPVEELFGRMGRPVPSVEARTSTSKVEVLAPIERITRFSEYSPVELYSQQLIGAYVISKVKRLGLFYDMRVGKTKTAIVAGRHAILTLKDADVFVLVCPKGNMYDPWVPELEAYGFDVAVIDGTYEEDEAAFAHADRLDRPYHELNGRPLAIVINYERVLSRQELFDRYLTAERIFVCMDETSAIKNPKASRSRAAHALCERAAYVVLLNGTPMEQGPQDLWSQLRCIDPHGVITSGSYEEWILQYLEEVAPGKFRVRRDELTRRAFEMMLATCSVRYIRGEADQFAGKDKNFRYIRLRATRQMATQARNVLEGFVQTIADGTSKYQSISECVLAVYGFLREISCGYDKYRETEGGTYTRVRHDLDPKLLWIRCFLETNPTEPLVVFLNFDEQEQRLKELLDEMHISWASMAPACRKIRKYRLRQQVPYSVYLWMLEKFGNERVYGGLYSGPASQNTTVTLPIWIRYAEDIVAAVRDRFYYGSGHSEEYFIYHKQEYSAQERAEQVARFNRGDAHVFILKVKQGRGISLSRADAVKNGIGTYPTIVYCSPPWSLGDWDQSQDRCVAVDPDTGKNVCTLIYALVVPGMEDAIMKALRAKKEVQAALLKDAERDGYQSFVENLVRDMETAVESGDGEGFFDADEMHARILCGVGPASRLTEAIVGNRMVERYAKSKGWKSRADVLRWAQAEPRCAVEFSEDGVVLNPDAQLREAFFCLWEQTPEYKEQKKVHD